MIKINLLPDELKKSQRQKKAVEFEILKFGPQLRKIAVWSFSVLIGVHLFLFTSVLLKTGSLRHVNSKWQRLGPKKAEVEKLNLEIAAVEKRISPIRQLIGEKMLWSKELNQISNLTTTGIWLTRLFIQPQVLDAQKGVYVKVLNLEGCAASLYGDETSLVAKFVKALQQDKEFSQYFIDIKLGPMERGMLDKASVMNFKVFCKFKKKE
jgi:hypothetical protein